MAYKKTKARTKVNRSSSRSRSSYGSKRTRSTARTTRRSSSPRTQTLRLVIEQVSSNPVQSPYEMASQSQPAREARF